jgi:hypothetical protein
VSALRWPESGGAPLVAGVRLKCEFTARCPAGGAGDLVGDAELPPRPAAGETRFWEPELLRAGKALCWEARHTARSW